VFKFFNGLICESKLAKQIILPVILFLVNAVFLIIENSLGDEK